ncbi:hypothetical protein AAF712_001688 [Marasmius tenuissimus]|uniref:ABC transporter domain-containing protein n=1 Tax=Marasmius tenuissimus TaxID=585030 RepID=A0ABR3AAX9_9AGAR
MSLSNRHTPTSSCHDDIALVEYLKPSSTGNGSVLSFEHLSYHISKKSGEKRTLVDDISVRVKPGELLAIMGPSGAGKSTLLDLMAYRKTAAPGAAAYLNGRSLNADSMYKLSAFVEQEDALLGVLTVRETVSYALRLHSPLLKRKEVSNRVDRVLKALGLSTCADQRIGTPIQRGISGGQKRRVTAACAMVTFPRILFLDEVTSGLDSTSAREVVSAIRTLAIAEGMTVIATIHQPSLETISQFTNLLMLSRGQVCYSGPVDSLESFFESWGKPVNKFVSPSTYSGKESQPSNIPDGNQSTPTEHAMNFLNEDFSASNENASASTSTATEFRQQYISTLSPDDPNFAPTNPYPEKIAMSSGIGNGGRDLGKAGVVGTLVWNTLVLSERSALNYARNLLAYGVRVGMYAGTKLVLLIRPPN